MPDKRVMITDEMGTPKSSGHYCIDIRGKKFDEIISMVGYFDKLVKIWRKNKSFRVCYRKYSSFEFIKHSDWFKDTFTRYQSSVSLVPTLSFSVDKWNGNITIGFGFANVKEDYKELYHISQISDLEVFGILDKRELNKDFEISL